MELYIHSATTPSWPDILLKKHSENFVIFTLPF